MIASKHIQFLVVVLGSLLAIYVGSNIVTLPPAGLAIVIAVIGVVLWMIVAGDNWWVPVLPGATIGGTFYVGFKVYPQELGLALAVIGLVPLVLVQDRKVFQRQRKPLPLIFYITGLYIAIRLLIDVIPADAGRGSLVRLALGFTWYFLFAFLFHHYASFSAARFAFGIVFGLLLVRTLAALVGFFANIPLIIPGVNYVLSFSSDDSLLSMRVVAFMLMASAMVLFHSAKTLFARFTLVPVFLFAAVLVIMGAGRFQTLVMLTLPLAFFAWSRRWILLLVAAVTAIGTIAVINVVPDSLGALPPSAGRALSGLVFTKNVSQTDFGTASSDAWHESLRKEGLRRLTESPAAFLFGDGIKFSPDLYDAKRFSLDNQEVIENAANMGAYENGLWAVIGLNGVIGFSLYLLLFIRLWRDTFPYFFRRPKGTFWEGLVFWGCYASVSWYVVSYFEGSAPGLEVVLMMLAWEVVQEGKLDEGPPGPPPAPFRASFAVRHGLPAHARG